MAATGRKQEDEYGIGAVARMTGLSDHVIRVWERRYGAIVARRAPNGRRMYSAADVEKLRLLKTLTDNGVSIGQVAAESVDALRERSRSMGALGSAALPERIGVAVLGDFLPGQFAEHDRDIAPVDIVVADNSRDTFVADLVRDDVDVLVVETAVLDSGAVERLRGLMEQAGASKAVLVYNFGRSRDISMAGDSDVVVLRAPVNVNDVCAAIVRACMPTVATRAKAREPVAEKGTEWAVPGEIPARRFNQQQLTKLARASTAIDCECPHHLAQLVGDLTAFEVYSAQCANRDEDDARLHRYLHQTTAQARALIEEALERVAVAEGIDY
ncbi:MAG: MerR family transcriptional regulator [Woeseiaceae bacterium]|nr:MerR family transcriptional regulator [Woeseiaceae bacterium]